jgi:hypothetical protein
VFQLKKVLPCGSGDFRHDRLAAGFTIPKKTAWCYGWIKQKSPVRFKHPGFC